MRLLLIEDDRLLGEGLREFLRGEGHVVDWCTTLAQVRSLASEVFDVWLVDWQLPDGSGLQWLHNRRLAGARTPALMLTARDRLHERVQGLDAGADDYLVKPFAPEELAARLRALERRLAPETLPELAGDVQLDTAARCAWRGGQRVELTAREYAILQALWSRAGRIVSRNELEQLILGLDAALASNAIEVHVSALRRKLGRELITTIRGLGYRLEVGLHTPCGLPS